MRVMIHRDGMDFGPYSLDEIKTQFATGMLGPHDYAWREGSSAWTPLPQLLAQDAKALALDPPTPPPEPSVAVSMAPDVHHPPNPLLVVAAILTLFLLVIAAVGLSKEILEPLLDLTH